jgi:hypothetical protein
MCGEKDTILNANDELTTRPNIVRIVQPKHSYASAAEIYCLFRNKGSLSEASDWLIVQIARDRKLRFLQ